MAIKTREELLTAFNAIIGENASDAALGLIEDITDTMNDYETKTADQTDWKHRYEENDASWRNRYKERFMSATEDDKKILNGTNAENKPDILTFENLFKEG